MFYVCLQQICAMRVIETILNTNSIFYYRYPLIELWRLLTNVDVTLVPKYLWLQNILSTDSLVTGFV